MHFRKLILIFTLLLTSACSSIYFDTLDRLGIHKRDLLVSRIESARDSQKEAQKQFKTALQSFKEVIHFNGGDLEKKYEKLKSQLSISESKAADIQNRIASVESVAQALFSEWKGELKSYSNDSLRESSEAELEKTRAKYGELLKAMRKAESRIEPVLQPFRDQVLFLKHNLNARAIGSIGNELASIESDVDSLLEDLQSSINEADSFVYELGK